MQTVQQYLAHTQYACICIGYKLPITVVVDARIKTTTTLQSILAAAIASRACLLRKNEPHLLNLPRTQYIAPRRANVRARACMHESARPIPRGNDY